MKKMNILKGPARYRLQRLLEEYVNQNPRGDFATWEDAADHFARQIGVPLVTTSNLRTALETIRKENYKMVKATPRTGGTIMSNLFKRLEELQVVVNDLQARIESLEEVLK